jgi:hypothetical protein
MNVFALEEPTKVKVTDVEVLSSKDRKPTDNPGAALNFSMVVGNDMLTMFDGYLKSALYMAVANKGDAPVKQNKKAQETLVPEVSNQQISSDMPKLTTMGMKLGEFAWDLELIGCKLNIEYGTNGPSGIEADGCKVYRFRIFGQEGGSVIIKYRVEFSDVDSATHGKLAMLKNCEAVITLTPPVVSDDAPMQNPMPFDADKKTDGEAPLSVEQAFEAAGQTS